MLNRAAAGVSLSPVVDKTEPVFQVSFDVPTLVKHLSAEDPLGLVIRAHIYVESALIRLIETALIKRDALDVTRWRFPLKVRLAVALGRIDPSDRPAYDALNRLRNRFAHDLHTELCDQDERDLYNTLSDKQRQIADNQRKPEMPFMGRLRCDLIGLILQMETAANKPAE